MKTRGCTLLLTCLALAFPGCSRERARVQPMEKPTRESVDLNGNGIPELLTETLPDGTRRTSTDRNENGIPELISEDFPNGDSRQQSDADEDGRMDRIRTYTAGKPSVLVTLSDEDFDGRMERRETITYFQPAEDAFRVVTETDEDGDGVFTVISDVTRKPAFTP